MKCGKGNIQQEIYVALTLHKKGNLNKARQEYRKLIRRYPNNPDILHFYGTLLTQIGNTKAAIESLSEAARLAPQDLNIHLNLFRALAIADKVPELESTLRVLTDLSPNDAFILAQLGEVLVRQGRADEAEPFYSRAVKANPNTFDAWNGLGNILERRGDFSAAEDCYLKSIAIEPARPEIYYNLGNVLRQQNKVFESIKFLKKAIEIKPEFILAHVHLAFSLLMNTDYLAGWQEYEWRWKVPNFPTPQRSFTQQMWYGETIFGKKVLVHAEQGFGDTIQFARFTDVIAKRGGCIILECQPELVNIMKTLPNVNQVLARGEALPDFDLHAPLLSIPYICSIDRNEIAVSAPYLQASSEKRKLWSDRLGSSDRIKVGITWQTSIEQLSSSFKSCPLKAYGPLLENNQVEWISLQKEISESDRPNMGTLVNKSDDLNDFSDTAALISELDLVISMDTAVAHLAGALGKPVWLLISTAGDWRWLCDRDDSPWYPTMRIFRQKKFNDWNNLMEHISLQIKNLTTKKSQKLS